LIQLVALNSYYFHLALNHLPLRNLLLSMRLLVVVGSPSSWKRIVELDVRRSFLIEERRREKVGWLGI